MSVVRIGAGGACATGRFVMRSLHPYGGRRPSRICARSATLYTSRGAWSDREGTVSAVKDSAKVGVIGGSGFYELLENAREVAIDTPFGAPSDSYFLGEIGGVSVAFLPRHARGHRILPERGQLPRQHLGHEGAGGALRAVRQRRRQPARRAQAARRGRPRPALRPHQGAAEHLLRRRRRRAHGLRRSVLPVRRRGLLVEHGRAVGATVHEGGTYVCIEGPQFSTRAEIARSIASSASTSSA